MILDAKNENITKELLEDALRYNRVKLSKAINSPKYIVLDWRGYPSEGFRELLDSLDEEVFNYYFSENIYLVNNPELLKIIYTKKSEDIIARKATPEYYWIRLVDWNVISDDAYTKMSDNDRLDMCVKNTDTIIID